MACPSGSKECCPCVATLSMEERLLTELIACFGFAIEPYPIRIEAHLPPPPSRYFRRDTICW